MSFTARLFTLLLVLVAGVAGYGSATLIHRPQVDELAILRRDSDEMDRTLRQERAQSKAAAEKLWKELQACQGEVAELRVLLARLDAGPRSRPRPSLASRGGRQRSGFRALQAQVRSNTVEVKELRSATLEYIHDRTPSGPPCAGELTSPYGPRFHPIYGTSRLHRGCDFTAPHGTTIVATAAGTVVNSDWLGGYGRVVEIDHGNGLTSFYAHCSEVEVTKGDQVQKGQAIARVGMTGLASGPHCHYEVHRNGEPIDPKAYL